MPNEDNFVTLQIENEVGWLTWVAKNTSIPVPKVYAFNSKETPYIAMEYVEGVGLDRAWEGLSDEQKESLSKGM